MKLLGIGRNGFSCTHIFRGGLCFFSVYFDFCRSRQGPREVCAALDVEMIKWIVRHVSDEDNDAFRVCFLNWFQNPWEPYYLSMRDDRAELKAFMLIMAMTLLNVSYMEGNENVEFELFFKVSDDDEDFSEAIPAVIALLFGIAASEVSRTNLFQLPLFSFSYKTFFLFRICSICWKGKK